MVLVGIEDAEAYPYMPGRHGARRRPWPRSSSEWILRKPDCGESGVLGGHGLFDALLRRQTAMASQRKGRPG